MLSKFNFSSAFAPALLALTHLSAFAAASCDVFSLNRYGVAMDSTYTATSSNSYVVSSGVVCTGGIKCTMVMGGYVTVDRTLNISTTAADDIFATIVSSINEPFNTSITGSISNGTFSITPNQTAGYYVGFTPSMRCARGVLSGCSSGGDVSNGTAVEACAAYPLAITASDRFPVVMGTISPVVTDTQTAQSFSCNPANMTNPYAAPGKCDGTSVVATTTHASAAAATSTGAAVIGRKADTVMAVLVGMGGVVAML